MPGRLDFKAIAESIDIAQILAHFQIVPKREPDSLRAHCPQCNSDRALEIHEDTNSFSCWKAPAPAGRKAFGGDCITLYAHLKGYEGQYRAAKELAELFGIANATRANSSTAPQNPEGRTVEQTQPAPSASKGFDADEHAKKFTYDGEIEGLTAEKARPYRIGKYRGKIHLPICPPGIRPAAFAQIENGKIKLPDSWLPDSSNVVTLKRA